MALWPGRVEGHAQHSTAQYNTMQYESLVFGSEDHLRCAAASKRVLAGRRKPQFQGTAALSTTASWIIPPTLLPVSSLVRLIPLASCLSPLASRLLPLAPIDSRRETEPKLHHIFSQTLVSRGGVLHRAAVAVQRVLCRNGRNRRILEGTVRSRLPWCR